jgi:hypothetical protein
MGPSGGLNVGGAGASNATSHTTRDLSRAKMGEPWRLCALRSITAGCLVDAFAV